MGLNDDIAGLARTVPVREVVEEYGGTRATAEALGVSQREVQRWLKWERGESGQVRSPHRNAAFGAAQVEMVWERLGQNGIVISEADVYMEISNDPRGQRDIHSDVELSGAQMQPVIAHLRAGEEEEAVQALKAPFMSEYGINPDVVERFDYGSAHVDFA